MIGVAVIIVFTMEAICKKADASKEYKKKRIDNLEKMCIRDSSMAATGFFFMNSIAYF